MYGDKFIDEGSIRQLKWGIQNALTSGSPLVNGDFTQSNKNFLKFINDCKSINDINYLRKDLNVAINTFNSLKKNLQRAIDNTSCNCSTCKEMRNRISKGLSIEKIDEQLKWINDIARPALNKKAKEL